MTKRVIEGKQSTMGKNFFIFKVNTVEKGPFPINDWAKILDKKGQVDTFILDFEKSF